VPFSSCALFLHDEEHDLLRCAFATGVEAELVQQLSLPNGQGVVGWVGRNLRPLVNARPGADFEAQGLQAPTALASALVCPLVFNQRLIGTLAVYGATVGCFTDDHRRLLDRVCEQASGVVHNALVFESAQRDALTDPLTGLPNIRSMFVHLARELARAERLGSEVSLLVLDLDGFKEINDVFGHHAGDQALRAVAHVLRTGIRPYDICVRYAGDEFVVVLPGCGPEEAAAKRLELQQAISAIGLQPRPGRQLQLGSSVGSSSYPQDGTTYEVLLATADRRMYDDKALRKRPSQPADQAPHLAAPRPSVFAKIDTQPTANRTH
jgi:diguanylate cyclase (GGDEF)-like protein